MSPAAPWQEEQESLHVPSCSLEGHACWCFAAKHHLLQVRRMAHKTI